MNFPANRAWWLIFLGAVAAGCGRAGPVTIAVAPPMTSQIKDIAEVSQTFVDFKKALEKQDVDKLWSMLDQESRGEAERQAKELQEAYQKANDEGKIEQVKELGVAGADLAKVTGPGYLTTKRFLGFQKIVALIQSEMDKVLVEGDQATVLYIDSNKDRQQLRMVREDGIWKVKAPMPK